MKATNPEKFKAMNNVEFKLKLIETLVGDKLHMSLDDKELHDEHLPIRLEDGIRNRCSYCAIMSKFSRTHYICKGCSVPLCCIGSGKTSDDCFTKAHKSNETMKMVQEKHAEMKKRTNERYKK